MPSGKAENEVNPHDKLFTEEKMLEPIPLASLGLVAEEEEEGEEEAMVANSNLDIMSVDMRKRKKHKNHPKKGMGKSSKKQAETFDNIIEMLSDPWSGETTDPSQANINFLHGADEIDRKGVEDFVEISFTVNDGRNNSSEAESAQEKVTVKIEDDARSQSNGKQELVLMQTSQMQEQNVVYENASGVMESSRQILEQSNAGKENVLEEEVAIAREDVMQADGDIMATAAEVIMDEGVEGDIVDGSTQAQCGECGYQATYTEVVTHMQGEGQIQCDICGQQWIDR